MPFAVDLIVCDISLLWSAVEGAAVKDVQLIKGSKAGVCVRMAVFLDVIFSADVRNQAVLVFLLMVCISCIISGSV